MWSLSTFITPFFAESLTVLIILRVILGIGEGLGEYCHYVTMLSVCMHDLLNLIDIDISGDFTVRNASK